MKLGELLKNVKKVLHDWSVFLTFAIIFTYLSFAGTIYQKPAVDSELEPYVAYFKDIALRYGIAPNFKNLSISFINTYPISNWVGLCQTSTVSPSKFLTVRESFFKRIPTEQKYALVIHELGHCTLGRDHVEGYLPNGCPKSIMHPSDGLNGCFFTNQDYYFKELFGLPQ
jgi:hypothetical protein